MNTLYKVGHKITIGISKEIIPKKKYYKKKRLRAYARALVYVDNIVDIIFAKFAWTVIDIEFLQSTFKSRKSLGIFQVIRDQCQDLRS